MSIGFGSAWSAPSVEMTGKAATHDRGILILSSRVQREILMRTRQH